MKRLILINLTALALLLGASNVYTSNEEATPIEFYVRTLHGFVKTFYMSPDTTVGELKTDIRNDANLRDAKISLVKKGKVLEDDKQLKDYGIKNRGAIDMFIRFSPITSTKKTSTKK